MILIHNVHGEPIYLDGLVAGDVDLEVIARGLSHACRFAGQLLQFYSVAQHAWLVSIVVEPAWAFPALHHDDSEALMGDVSRELKHHPGMDWYRALEARVQEACHQAVGIGLVGPEAARQIKIADDLVAVYERAWIRDRRPFHLGDIDSAVDTGWIRRSTREDMRALAHRLPPSWAPWNPHESYINFVTLHDRWKTECHETGAFV